MPATALLLAAGLAGCSTDPDYSSRLQRYDDDTGLENTIVDLPGGDRLSVGSPDGHDVVVQRYDAGSAGWSAPEVVHTEPRLWTHAIDTEHAGSTVGISVDYWEEERLDDDYAPELSIGVLCAETCTSGARPPGPTLSTVHLDDHGNHAVFGLGDDSYAVWDGGDEWRTEMLEDFGEDSEVRFAGDGSFHALTFEGDPDQCVYTLHTTEPHELDFTEQASFAPVPGPCGGGFNGTDEDDTRQAAVWVEAISGVIEFKRTDDGWQAVPLPQEHDTVPDTGGRATLAPIFDGGEDGSVVLYSPDMRTIWAQSRLDPGRWARPRAVFSAPEGVTCRTGRFAPSAQEHELHALLDCFTGGGGPGGEPDTTLALVSTNGQVWNGGLVNGAGRYAKDAMTFDVVVSGTPGMLLPIEDDVEPEELALPFPAPTTDPLHLETESLLRVAPRMTAGRCRATAWSAPSPQARTWEKHVTFDVPLRAGRCPELHLTHTEAGVRVTATGSADWKVALRLEDGNWAVS